jgi:predicted nucleic acid-binding protein
MIVLNSSAVVELLLQSPRGKRLDATLREVSGECLAPHLLDLVVLSALRRISKRGATEGRIIRRLFDDLAALRVRKLGRRRSIPATGS